MNKPPITLFTYNRPKHTRITVEALLENDCAAEHDLIVYSDASNTAKEAHAVELVRDYLKTVTGFRSVTIYERPHNYGLAQSIITGVSEVLSSYENIIVLEDDLVTSKYFLRYMTDALDRYESNDRIVSISGYNYPIDVKYEAFCLRGADCWGWATWRRGWNIFNADSKALLEQLQKEKLIKQFDLGGACPYTKMLKSHIQGKNDSWAIRWHASAFLKNKLTIYPGNSLVNNIGNDNTGTNGGIAAAYNVELTDRPVELGALKITEYSDVQKTISDHLTKQLSFFSRLKNYAGKLK